MVHVLLSQEQARWSTRREMQDREMQDRETWDREVRDRKVVTNSFFRSL